MENSLFFLLIILLPILFLIVLWIIVRPKPAKISIRNRHVFISGGSSGIGLALAHIAAQEGAHVSILARNITKLEQARDSVEKATGVKIRIFSADVRNFEEISRVMEEAGPIDVLVCNHGVAVPDEFEKQSVDTIKFMMDINWLGTIHLIKAALPRMKSNASKSSSPAAIALVSSQVGQVGMYGYVGYASSKFALRGLAESLQQELVEFNIRVSLLFPPDTNTPGFIEENKTKPDITKLLSETSSSMEAYAVAVKAIKGIKSGQFVIPCNFEGFMLSIATAGMSPQPSPLLALIEVTVGGLLRVVALFTLWNWYNTVHKYYNGRKNSLPVNEATREQ